MICVGCVVSEGTLFGVVAMDDTKENRLAKFGGCLKEDTPTGKQTFSPDSCKMGRWAQIGDEG